MRKSVLVVFGGVSAEHEVSVVTGLQALENIDTEMYEPLAVYIDKAGKFLCIPGLRDRRKFLTAARRAFTFSRDTNGGFIKIKGTLRKIYPYAAYLALHGGQGESGPMQGLLEAVGIPFTSPGQEASVVMMNKELTKETVSRAGIDVVPGMDLFSSEIKAGSEQCAKKITGRLGLPVIVKPAHLGSSIGIKIARAEVELEKSLLEAAAMDKEILVEKYLSSFVEYNCAVRLLHGNIEASEVERPFSNEEILSFADKYERGGKKMQGGMASLNRELPAKIDDDLKQKIQELAKKAFVACRGKGMIRADFMYASDHKLYLTELNPIPGSMAFYLWEASGIPFKQQISELILQAVEDAEHASRLHLDYKTDIVERFVNQ